MRLRAVHVGFAVPTDTSSDASWPLVVAGRASKKGRTAIRNDATDGLEGFMTGLSRGIRKLIRLIRTDGYAGLAERIIGAVYRRVPAGDYGLPVQTAELVDSSRLALPIPSGHVDRGRSLSIGWVTTPPSLGSGGHTTLYRMVEAAEQAGHHCVLFFYDRFDGDLAERAAVLRQGWPSLKAEVADVRAGVHGVDVAVASSWSTAHALARYGTSPSRRLYFIQDYEPYFFPRGSEYALAEDTYRFGFRTIALGHMVANCLASETGLPADDVVEFGCDTAVYNLTNKGSRSGIIFYAKPDVARRGYLLGRLALEEFHARHPEQEIHIYGEQSSKLPFPATFHARLLPADLATLYNRCIAGIGISFTNISLVVEEMLACGVIPVVNDSPLARADMPSSSVAWSQPTPGALADGLCRAVESVNPAEQAVNAAASVRTDGWSPAQRGVVAALEDAAYGTPDQVS